MSASRTPAGPLRAIAEELARGGVHDVVICPGSRSTPLALALAQSPDLRCWVHLDERAGAFFALGAAKAARRPAAILATSGTAVVNFAPAVTEARYGRVPLILLTADRPPELQGRGAPQTIDQVELYGRQAKGYAQVPPPGPDERSVTTTREIVAAAVAQAVAAPAGPVQLNLPFREPLLPVGPLASLAVDSGRPTPVPSQPRAADVEAAAMALARARRALIVCGPLDVPGFPAAVARLAAAAGSPVLADGLANVRTGSHDRSRIIDHHDAILRCSSVAAWSAPDLVLRFGATPTSKALNLLLDTAGVPQLLVDDGGGWERPPEPTLLAADPVSAADQLADALGAGPLSSDYLERWQAADAAAAEALQEWRARRAEPFEGALFEDLAASLPGPAILLVGNSMPVRDLDAFMAGTTLDLRALGNRGASGIDGLVSTALGAAAAQELPVLAVIGDLSFLHDLTALVAARRLGLSATIVLVNNDGGGIFSFLPQATAELPETGLPAHYEELFGTPHGTDFGPLVRALGGEHVPVADDAELRAAVLEGVARRGVRVVEVRTERRRNVELHREALAAVSRALETAA